MEKHKRERNVNFTEEETDLLVLLAGTRKHVIESKKSDAATWQEKEKAWKDIETAFNATSRSVFRDHKHLKFKYEALKRDARKKSRIGSYKTDGGTSISPILTPAEKIVKEMILRTVEGNESSHDSDVVVPNLFKYEALKRDARKKSRDDCCKTDGGTSISPVLSPAEKIVKEMILRTVEENESSHDSDVVVPNPYKYEALKDARKRSRDDCCKTDGGTSISPVLSPAEKGVKEMILGTVEGNECSHCSDVVMLSKFKYETLKRDARKKSRVDIDQNGGGASIFPVLTPAEQTVKEIIHVSVEGNESSNHDSHVVMPNERKEKKPLDALLEEKLEIAKIQKQIAMEELQEKLIQRKMLEKELEHKEIMHKLERQHLLLKMELLQKEHRTSKETLV